MSEGNEATRTEDSIGSYLARQRRLRGISLDELEQLTRIPRRSLERLESGIFDGNPDGFVRGFVRTVALALGLDPDEAVSRMLDEVSPEGQRRVGLRVPLGPLGALIGLLCAVLLVGLWIHSRFQLPGETAALPTEQLVRRDPVRALAEAAAVSQPLEATREESRPAQGAEGSRPRP
ncbi:MAG: helix-turn-helix domain-containing protein [Proteobacteria bacterium]|nr:helix-turn-helix domain-containing protein [Pseudomonadota bacterium]